MITMILIIVWNDYCNVLIYFTWCFLCFLFLNYFFTGIVFILNKIWITFIISFIQTSVCDPVHVAMQEMTSAFQKDISSHGQKISILQSENYKLESMILKCCNSKLVMEELSSLRSENTELRSMFVEFSGLYNERTNLGLTKDELKSIRSRTTDLKNLLSELICLQKNVSFRSSFSAASVILPDS